VITADEVVEAVQKIKPNVATPMHCGVIVGGEQDVQKFKGLAKTNVVFLTPE